MRHKNGLWTIVEFQHVKPGKGPAFVRSKLKNVENGKVVDHTFRAGEKVEEKYKEVSGEVETEPGVYLDLGLVKEGLFGSVMLPPVPLIIVHVPVPLAGSFAARVAGETTYNRSGPAFETGGVAKKPMFTSSSV